MIAMTRPDARLARTHHHPFRTAALVFLCWIGSAALVATAHAKLDSWSTGAGAVAVIATIFAAAGVYMRLLAPQSDSTHALGVGIAWLLMTIVVEMTMSTIAGHGWYSLLGSPGKPLLRNLFLFVWIFAPVCFARTSGIHQCSAR